MKIYKYSIWALILLSNIAYSAIDSVVVQTFTFDSLYNRRAKFQMPNTNDSYRKILMEYRLKCDPRTAHDKYNCGEWDYLTYNMIYKTLPGNDTTYSKNNYLYKLNYFAADTLVYYDKIIPQANTYKVILQKPYKKVTKDLKDSLLFELNGGFDALNFEGKKNRFQIYFSKAELKAMGLNKSTVNRISFVSNNSIKLKNLNLKIANISLPTTTRFINSSEVSFDLCYDNAFNVIQGVNFLTFNSDYTWNGFTGMLIDFSFEKESSNDEFYMVGSDSLPSIFSNTEDNFLKFDGKNDFIFLGSLPKLNGINQFTFETWIRVDEWNKWATVFGNGKNQIELGDAIGDLYVEIRPQVNSYAKLTGVLKLGIWNQVTVVFNGNGKTNADKLKIYINGDQTSPAFTNQIPDKTTAEDLIYSFSNLANPNNSFNGGLNETRIWNYAFTDADVKANFTKLLSSNEFDYSKLIAYYAPSLSSDSLLSEDAISLSKINGKMIGIPNLMTLDANELYLNQKSIKFRPLMRFYKSNFEGVDTLNSVNLTFEKEPSTLIKYKVDGKKLVPDQITKVYKDEYKYTYNSLIPMESTKIDSVLINNIEWKTQINSKFDYITNISPKTEPFEIGRFITPYGINLDLGPDGFCWTYDVTDYADLLKGEIDFAVGNQQELVDVKFIFIKGTPPRNIIERTKIWGDMASYSYASLSNDDRMTEKTINLNPNAKQFKIKTRLTGHGHNSNTGNAPHCCEWKDNTHTLVVNNSEYNWHIWQTYDCGTNPVYPQGGTWPHAREGWCPGDKVKDYEFEVTDAIKNGKAVIDYGITPVPENNLGMGGGNYVMNFDFLQYSDFNFQKDCEIYDVIAPSNNQYYSRKNPICSPPIIRVRNNGATDVTSLKITYHVSGGQTNTYDWANKVGIKPHSMIDLELPIPDANFWVGDSKKYFYATITEVNGGKDDYQSNDTYISTYNMPDILGYNPVFVFKTNLRGSDFSYKITDMKGNLVRNRASHTNNTTYNDTLKLADGCYTLDIFDVYGYGLSYWAIPDQGSGFFRILDNKGTILKSFNPDCGFGYKYSFYVGNFNYVEETNFENLVDLFPNPAVNYFSLKSKYEMGLSDITLTNINGVVIMRDKLFVNLETEKKYDISNYPSGLYYLTIKNGTTTITKKFLKD